MASRPVRCGRRTLDVGAPRVMGILNVTPDSFSDGARFLSRGRVDREAVADAAARMVAEGAAILDVGGESTRPGALPVDEHEELGRIVPVLERLTSLDVPISVDTRKPAVAAVALQAGASLINDVYGLRAGGMIEAIADSGAAVCIMHMKGEPQDMQLAPVYDDVVGEVRDFLAGRVAAAQAAGIALDRIVVDPGFGFGKTFMHNLALLRHLDRIAAIGVPVLVGLSRKRMIGTLTGREVGERTPGSVAAAVLAVAAGARIVRAHDVAATVDALAVAHAVLENTNDSE